MIELPIEGGSMWVNSWAIIVPYVKDGVPIIGRSLLYAHGTATLLTISPEKAAELIGGVVSKSQARRLAVQLGGD